MITTWIPLLTHPYIYLANFKQSSHNYPSIFQEYETKPQLKKVGIRSSNLLVADDALENIEGQDECQIHNSISALIP